MANAKIVISRPGPLPVLGDFELHSQGTVLLMLAGSVYTKRKEGLTGVTLHLDGDVIGKATIYAVSNNVHYALVPLFVSADLAHGTHKVAIKALDDMTVGDQNDYFSLAVLI